MKESCKIFPCLNYLRYDNKKGGNTLNLLLSRKLETRRGERGPEGGRGGGVVFNVSNFLRKKAIKTGRMS